MLKGDIFELREKLNLLEKEYNIILTSGDNPDLNKADLEIVKLQAIEDKSLRIDIDVGGKIFRTKAATLLKAKGSLFYNIIMDRNSKGEPENDLIFVDRNYTYFDVFLNYLRTSIVSFSGYNTYEKEDIYRDSLYYGFTDISEKLEFLKQEVEFVNFFYSGRYSNCGTDKLEDLKDRNLNSGICANTPGYIIIELSYEVEISEIEVGGWGGNPSMWYPGNGASAQVYTSLDNANFTLVGYLPSNFGNFISLQVLTKSFAKFIKFQNNSLIGLGFLNIVKKN